AELKVIAFEPFAVPACDGLCCRGQQRQHHGPHFVEATSRSHTVEYVHILEEKFCLDNVVIIQDLHHVMGPRPIDLVGHEVPNFVKAQNA
ncbi:Hypothetical protein FKW44_016400, partial [Caligus rogercresseyi]